MQASRDRKLGPEFQHPEGNNGGFGQREREAETQTAKRTGDRARADTQADECPERQTLPG